MWNKIKYGLSDLVPPNYGLIVATISILFIATILVSCGHSPSLDDGWLYHTVK